MIRLSPLSRLVRRAYIMGMSVVEKGLWLKNLSSLAFSVGHGRRVFGVLGNGYTLTYFHGIYCIWTHTHR